MIALLCPQNAVLLPHRRREHLGGRVTDGKRLGDGAQNRLAVESCRQGIDGQHPPGGDGGGIRAFKHRIGHPAAHEVPGEGSVEDVFPAIFQIVTGKAGVKKGQMQPSGGIGHLHLCHVQALADVVCPRGVHYHGAEAGGFVHFQIAHVYKLRAVFIAPGEVTDKIFQSENIQGVKELCLCRADAPQDGNGVSELCHGITSFSGCSGQGKQCP